jgi:hypothetical protein
MNDEDKKEIDGMDYRRILDRLVKFAPSSSKWVQGEIGAYFLDRLVKLRAEVGDEEHSRISKNIGWS